MGLIGFIKKNEPAEQGAPAQESINYEELLPGALRAFFNESSEAVIAELNRIAGGSRDLAQQLYWFYPTALFKHFIPQVKYANDGYYTVCYENGSKKNFSFSENELYCVISGYLEAIYTDLSRQQLLSVLFHSAEFDAVNKALNNGSKLEDLMVFTVYMST